MIFLCCFELYLKLRQLDACDNLMKELKKRDMQLHMGKALGFLSYSEFLDVIKTVFYTKVPVRIQQLMDDILEGTAPLRAFSSASDFLHITICVSNDSEGHPGEDDPPPCEEVGKDVKYESLFKEDREYNQASSNTFVKIHYSHSKRQID
jgi:hypothetical protein